jgi:hypothetical protein
MTMDSEITFRLVVNGKVICERHDINEVMKVKDSLSEDDKQVANIIPITKNGSQFLLG